MPAAIPISTTAKNPAWRWAKAGILAALIACLCYGGVRLLSPKVRDLSADEVRELMSADKLPLDNAIDQLNRMDVRDRREVMQSADAQKYFQNLKPADRMRFVNETLDRGIRENINRYRKMNKEEKQAFIQEIQQAQAEQRERLQNMSPEEKAQMQQALEASNFEQIVENAVKAYLSASTSEERSELAPLFDGALDNMKTFKGLK